MRMRGNTIFTIGDRVLTDIGKAGRVISIRFDSNGDCLILVALDDASATPDGFYLARDFELKREIP